MDKKSTKLLHNPVPLKIRTEEDIERERRDFFRNCERISRAPASIFLEGNRFSRKAKLFALPFYAYAGIEKGHYERFMYEEFEWRKPSSEKIPYFIENGKIRKRLPHEEKVMFKSETPISSIRDDRMLNYQIYFNEELKKYLIRREEIEKLIQKGESFDSIVNRKKVDFKELEPKFKGYFKIKVWSEIPPYIGLNEGAAIATAVAFLVELELFPTNVNRAELIQKILDLKINRPEEIIVDWLFMGMFSRALQFDFFSNGAAVFASIMGNSGKQDTINYECLFYSEMKRFFEPRPEISHKDIKLHMQAFEKIRKVKGINAYFEECSNLSKKTLDTTPLFNWNYSKIEFKNKQELVLSVMERRYISGDDRDFKVPLDTEVELHLLSQVAFAVIGDPSLMVLCERKPEKYIFGKEKDEVYSKYSPLYSSRTNGWEVQGASVTELKKPKEILEEKRIESNKAILDKYDKTIQKWLKKDEKLDYSFSKYFKNSLVIWTDAQRTIFARESNSKIEYLYDSVSLIKDWDVKKLRFRTHDAKNINIHLHLAISFLRDFSLIDAEDALREFIKLNPDAIGVNSAKTIQECSELFPMSAFGFSLFGFVYTRLHMVNEAGIAYELMGKEEDCVTNTGYGLILQSRFDEAIYVLEKEYNRLESELENELRNSKKDVFSFPHSLTKSLLNDIGGLYFWAAGMKFWSHEKWKEAEHTFSTAYDFFKEKETAKSKLMGHLSEIVRYRNKALDMASQRSLIDKYEEKKEVIQPETPAKVSLERADAEIILQGIKDVKEEVARIGLVVNREKIEVKKKIEGEKAEINFIETEVQVSGQNALSKDNPLILAEYIILKEKVHWLWAFVILPEFETKRPKWQFRNYLSKKRIILKKYGIKITALKKAEDDYAKFEGIEDGVKSNIQDAKEYYNKAVSFFNEDKLNDAIKELNKITTSYYKWYSFTDVYIKLTELIRMINFNGISEKLIGECRDFLNWYKKRLQIGILRIEFYKKQVLKNKFDELTELEFQKIKDELKNVEENLQALVQKVPLSKEDEEYEVFVKFLIDAQEKLMFIQEQEAETEETRQEVCIQAVIEIQKENKYFDEVVKNALKVMGNELYRLDKSKTYSDKILRDESREIYWLVCELILDLKNFDEIELNKGNRLGMLMGYFNKGTVSKIKKWLSGALDFKFRT